MRRFFVVSAKLLGLLQVYWGVAYIGSSAIFLSQLSRMAMSERGGTLIILMGMVGLTVVHFGVAWLLIARTEWLADRLQIEDDGRPIVLSDDRILDAGIKVLGVYIFVQATPGLIQAVCSASSSGLWVGNVTSIWTMIVPAVLRVFLALLLTIRTSAVLRLFARAERLGNKTLILGGCVILAMLVVVGRSVALHPWLESLQHRSSSVTDSFCEPCVPVDNEGEASLPREWLSLPEGEEESLANSLPDMTNTP